MKEIIHYIDFEKIDIRVGTIIDVEENNKLNKPSFILKIDFGEIIGVKKSSAQLRKNYSKSDLINKQIAAIINFKPKQIGNVISEVLVLGFPDNNFEPILITTDKYVQNGGNLY